MFQKENTINAINKEPKYIKFSVVRQKKVGTASISKGLRELFQASNASYLEYGIDTKQNGIYVRLNNEEKGSSLLGKEGEPRNTIAASILIRYLINEDIEYDLSKPLFLQQVSKDIYLLTVDATKEEKIDDSQLSIKWLSTESSKAKIQSESLNNDLWIKFYNTGIRRGFIRISKGLLTILSEREMTHLEFGFNRETKSLFIRANNRGNGAGLLDALNEYKESQIVANNILAHLSLTGIDVEYLNPYFLHPVDNSIYEISTSKPTANVNSESIVWIPTKKPSAPEQIEFRERHLKSIKEKAEERKKRKLIIEKRKSLTLEAKELKEENRITAEFDENQHQTKKLREKNQENQNSPFHRFTFRFADKPGKKGTMFSISKAFRRACIQQQATHLQFGITDHNIFLRVTENTEGISLVDSRGEYKGLQFGATYSLKEINKEVERLKLNETYTLKRLTDTIYLVEGTEVLALSNETNTEDVVWLLNTPPLTLKKQTDSYNRDKLTFSNILERTIKQSQNKYLDIGYNENMQIVALKFNDNDGGVLLRKEGVKRDRFSARLLAVIKEVGIKMEYNVEYEFRKTSPNSFNIISNQDLNDFQHSDRVFWVSQTLSIITNAKQQLSKELKTKELKSVKEMLKAAKIKEDQADKQLFEKMSIYQKNGTNREIDEIKKEKLTFKFITRKTSTYLSLSKAFYNTCVEHQFTHFQLALFHNHAFVELNNNGDGFSLIDSNRDYLPHHPSGLGASHFFNRVNSKVAHFKANKTYVLEEIDSSLFKIVNSEDVSTQDSIKDNKVLRVSNASPLYFKKANKTVLVLSAAFNTIIKDSKKTFIDVGYNSNKEIVAISLNSEGNGVELICDEDGCRVSGSRLLAAIESTGIKLEGIEPEFQQVLPNYFSLLTGLEVDSTNPTKLSWLSQSLVRIPK
ncbi:hypothetical protein WKH56_08540 [Priestia sp. SB1]|uniref:hypothetical protein n=1 Tax=Priestia sp. SB1 TaxID=3132359 RepID=UPI00316DE7B5